MDIRSAQPMLRPITAAAAVLLGLALTFAAWPAAAQQWTPQQRRGSLGIWNGWRDIEPQNSATACTGHAAAKVLTTLAISC